MEFTFELFAESGRCSFGKEMFHLEDGNFVSKELVQVLNRERVGSNDLILIGIGIGIRMAIVSAIVSAIHGKGFPTESSTVSSLQPFEKELGVGKARIR